MDEEKLNDPTFPETGKWGRLFVAGAISCLLHVAALMITIGEHASFQSALARKTGFSPAMITARLVTEIREATPVSQPIDSIGAIAKAAQPGTIDPPPSLPKPLSAAAGLLPLPGPAYYTSDQLTRRPQAIAVAELDPPLTRPHIVSGKLILQLWIDDTGKVVDVVVEDSNLPAVFAETASNAFKHSRFTPGERNGVPVGSLMRIEVSYEDTRLPGQ